MKYTNYTVMDLVMDEYFQQWILHPNEETHTFWQQWLALHPEKSQYVQEARSLLLMNRFEENRASTVRLEEIKDHIKNSVKVQPVSEVDRYRYTTSGNFSWRKMVAIVGLLFLVGLTVFAIHQEKKLALVTNYGQIKEFLLPDSSRVFLNANSSLKCLHSWKKDQKREVWLNGEAFFKVAKKENHNLEAETPYTKFVVHAEDLDIEVLGTQFNVNNRRGAVEVVLNEGKVRILSKEGKEVDMQPGEMLTYSSKSKSLVKTVVDAEKQTSWRNHQLFFDGQSLGEVSKILETYYGIQVTFVKPDLKNKRIVGTLPSNNLDVIIESLHIMYGIQIKKEGNKILFQ